MLEQLVADDFFVIDFGFLHSLMNQGISILALPFIFDIPGEVVTCPPKRSPVIMLVNWDKKGGINGKENLHSRANH